MKVEYLDTFMAYLTQLFFFKYHWKTRTIAVYLHFIQTNTICKYFYTTFLACAIKIWYLQIKIFLLGLA